MRLRGILLAAGASRRFGGCKLRARLPDGEMLVVRAARNLLAGTPRALAVIRPADTVLARMLSGLGLEIVECARAQRGMGASLACGVAAAADADGWIVALGDMPGVDPSTVRRLVAAIESGARAAAPFHSGRRGLPVGFGRVHRDALLALDGDRGARDIIAAAAGALHVLDVDDPGVLWDVDEPPDLLGSAAAAESARP